MRACPWLNVKKHSASPAFVANFGYHAADHGLASEPSSLLQEAAHEPFWIFLSHRYAAIESKAAIGHIWELLQVVIDYRMYEILVFKARFAFLYDI